MKWPRMHPDWLKSMTMEVLIDLQKFWPDGQTDDCVYMIRTVTEMRETVKRTGSSRQKDLIKFLDDPKVFERDYVMIVARP